MTSNAAEVVIYCKGTKLGTRDACRRKLGIVNGTYFENFTGIPIRIIGNLAAICPDCGFETKIKVKGKGQKKDRNRYSNRDISK